MLHFYFTSLYRASLTYNITCEWPTEILLNRLFSILQKPDFRCVKARNRLHHLHDYLT